jgi:hypothetical protein
MTCSAQGCAHFYSVSKKRQGKAISRGLKSGVYVFCLLDKEYSKPMSPIPTGAQHPPRGDNNVQND